MTESTARYHPHVAYDSSNEPLSACSTTWEKETDTDCPNRKAKWSATVIYEDTLKPNTERASTFLRNVDWPSLLKKLLSSRCFKKQGVALVLLLACGMGPFIAVFEFAGSSMFEDKTISCGELSGAPQNSTVEGVEGLFVLDSTFGRFPFSQAKSIDVAWDLLVGRGAQLLAWWASYIVFSDALLRVIERHPTSYRTFRRIALDGPTITSMWALVRDLFRTRSRRTKCLFIYMIISTSFVLSIPVFVSAMTGYVNTLVAWVDVDGNDQIVPISTFTQGQVIWGSGNTTFANKTCSGAEDVSAFRRDYFERFSSCDCQMPNGTIIPAILWRRVRLRQYDWGPFDCEYDYPGSNGTYMSGIRNDEIKNCNATYNTNITVFDREYDAKTLLVVGGYCYNGVGYEAYELSQRTRCLPDTANPAYQWGFSSMLSAIFVFLLFAWTLTMYVVWQDAQLNSKLVKKGFKITPLRAAFALASAATRRTGLDDRALVRADTAELEKELYGTKKPRCNGADITYDIFRDGERDDELQENESLRKRGARTQEEDI